MRDVAIARSEFVPGEQAVTKLQEFQNDDVLFGYCELPEVLINKEYFIIICIKILGLGNRQSVCLSHLLKRFKIWCM